MPSPAHKTFEDAQAELAALVEKLENGELSLEDALAAFEQGVTLVRYLGDTLTAVEQRVEVLTRDLEGRFQTRELTEADES